MFNRKRIEFHCSSGVPYERVQYLESLGVKVWPTGDVQEKDNGTRTVVILVKAPQHAYAAGLLQGAPGTIVLDPHPVAPIQPRTRWGVTGKRAQGPNATVLRIAARLMGIQAETPPVAPKPAQRPQKKTAAAPARATKRRKPTKRKSTKPSAVRRLWDSLKDE